MLRGRAVSSVGQSACLTSRMSPVRVWDRPPFYKPLSNQGLYFLPLLKFLHTLLFNRLRSENGVLPKRRSNFYRSYTHAQSP